MKAMTQILTKNLFANRITKLGMSLLPLAVGLAIIPSAPLQVKANNLPQAKSFEQNRTTAQPRRIASAKRGKLLKIASLNVKLMPAGAAAARTLEVSGHRTSYNHRLSGFAGVTTMRGWRDGGEIRNGFDIIGFQEVWRHTLFGDTHFVALSKGLRQRGFQQKNILRGTGKGTERGWHHGLVIASKYPIVDSAEMKFSKATSWDGLAEKGVLFARVNVNGTTVAVFNTHLQAGVGKGPTAVRDSQLRQMRRFFSQHARRGEPIVIMGDFNIDRTTKSCLAGKTTEYCSWMKGGKAGNNWLDFRDNIPKAPRLGLDYIITAGPGAATVTGQTSEHWVYVNENGRTGLSSTKDSKPTRQQITDHPLIYGAFWVSH